MQTIITKFKLYVTFMHFMSAQKKKTESQKYEESQVTD